MRFRLLGPVEVSTEAGPVAIVRRQERCLLGILLLEAGQVVPADRLVDLLWDGATPEHGRRSVQVHVARIRASLPLGPDESLESGHGGYALHVDPDSVDAHRFRALVAAARAVGAPQERADLLTRSLGLWRGTFMQDSADDRLRHRIGTPLAALRLDATEELLATRLALGPAADLLPELTRMATEHPDRERFAELRMEALRRLGREVEALEVYREARRYLAEELGLDPSPRLQSLHAAILRQEPADGDPERIVVRSGPAGLPAAVTGFVGRRAEIAQLEATLGAGDVPRAFAIVGPGGVGKTALCVHWGQMMRSHFIDGQLYVDMHGYSSAARPVTPADALSRFLRALEVPDDQIPSNVDEAAALYRSTVADRRVLVVIDNVREPDQVRPLIPGGKGCVTLITSRDALDGLVAVDGVQRVDLDVLPDPDALSLLSGLLGEARVWAEPAAAAELAAACAGLPLALRVTAARLSARPRRRLAEHVAELRRGDRLDALSIGADRSASVAATLDLSYVTLPDPAARAYRLFGICPAADLDSWGLAALTGTSVAAAETVAGLLQSAHMLTEVSPGRLGLHDLVRLHAAQHAVAVEPDPARHEALARLVEWYVDASEAANIAMRPGWSPQPWKRALAPLNPRRFDTYQDAMAWFDREHTAIVALATHAIDEGIGHAACPLLRLQSLYLINRHDTASLIDINHLAWSVATASDDTYERAAAAHNLGVGYSLGKRTDEAVRWYEQAMVLNGQLGRDDLVANGHVNLASLLVYSGQLDRGADELRRGLELARRIGNRVIESMALGNLGHTYLEMNRLDLALTTLIEAIDAQRHSGNRVGEGMTENTLGLVYLRLGRYDEAMAHACAALAIAEETGERLGIARDRMLIGDVHQAVGEVGRARELWQQALDEFERIESVEADEARQRLRDAPD